MSWEKRWKIMADLVTELKRSGEPIPTSVMKDLRSAKTMIEILNVDKSWSNNLSKIEEYLSNVEAYLAPAAERRFGTKYAEEFSLKLIAAQRTVQYEKHKPPTKILLGLPRDIKWIRMRETGEISLEKIKHLAEEIGLKYEVQEDGYVFIYGEENRVKSFIKKTAESIRESEHGC
ncbi:MAG: DUF2096 family protein [Candidatus Bathyarchaeia archaeon]